MAFGGKFSFWQGDDGAGAAFAAALLRERSDGGWRQSVQDLNIIYSRHVSDGLTTHLNLGHRRDRTDGRQMDSERARLATASLKLAF